MLYESAKPCGFSIAKVTFLGHARRICGKPHQRPASTVAGDEAIIEVEQEAGLSLLTTAYGPGRVPPFASAYVGRKRYFSNALTPCARALARTKTLSPAVQKHWKGLRPISANLFRMFFVKFPQNRHPERSASQIYRVTQRLWRGVEGPRRCLSYPCCSDLFDHRSPRAGFAAVRTG